MGGQVRTQKANNRERTTHILETAEGETSQDMEGNRLGEGHSQTGNRRMRCQSGRINKLAGVAHRLETIEDGDESGHG